MIGPGVVAPAAAAIYSVQVIPRLGVFGPASPTGINSSGQVVGFAPNSVGQTHAFFFSGGTTTDLGTLGGNYSNAFGLNDSGQVVGESLLAGGGLHAFVYSGGAMSDLGTLGGSGSDKNSTATAISNSGQIAGYSQTSNSSTNHAFLFSGGSMSDLGTLGGGGFSNAYGINESTQIVGHSNGDAFIWSGGSMTSLGATTTNAFGINESGQIAGYTSTGVDHAFLYSGGTLTDLGTLGGPTSIAHALNDSAQVVGFSSTASGANHGFLYSGGTMQDLNSLIGPGYEIFNAFGINNAGQIVALGIDSTTGQTQGLLLSPAQVPEPTSLLLWGLGGVALALGAARRRKRPR